jgi:LPS-assembly protein
MKGRDNTRLSFDGGYDLPLTGLFGDIYTLKANVQAQAYWTDGVDPGNPDVNPSDDQGSDVTGRFLPQFGFDWRLPVIQENEGWQQLLEPRFQVVAAPPFGNPDEIPNEDSVGFELDDANLFELNRFPGLDVADAGSRIDYGLSWHGTWDDGTAAEAFFGQSYQFIEADDDIFPDGSGVGDAFSDFVGRVQFSPLEVFNFQYRFRLDKDSLDPQRSEIEAQFVVPAFTFDVEYLFADNQATSTEFADREELNFSLSSQLTENWSAFGSHRRDLEQGRALSWSLGMGYEDECFTIDGVFRRRFFDDREIEPENTFFLQINFKHLGGLQSS